MTIKRIFYSIRRFGIKGVWEWFVRTFFIRQETDPVLSTLLALVKTGVAPVRGITIIGDFNGQHSLNKVLRDFSDSLRQAGIPHQTIDIGKKIDPNLVVNRYSDIITMTHCFNFTGLSGCRQHRIVFWEFETGLAELFPELIDGNPILTFSQFCFSSVKKQVSPKTAVAFVRYPFHFEAHNLISRAEIRQKYGIPTSNFMVFYNFDYASSYYRKNPEGLLEAFVEAFKETNDAILVFKTNSRRNNNALADHLEQLAAHAAVASRVIFINDYISADDLVSLTASCDVYASLHRGEGFGLGMAEAMSMGKAVVATGYGANTEFCTSETSALVPYKIIDVDHQKVDADNIAYAWINEWPEPDIHAAASALRKLYEDPALRLRLGENGKHFIEEHFSIANFKKSIDTFLDND